jgi:hypothetical protein
MIRDTLIQICSYSILFAVIIGLVRFRKINRTYQPFIFIIVLSLLSEIASPIAIRYYGTNAVVVNVFILLEFLLWLWQFKRWRGFARRSQWKYPALFISFSGMWIVENVILSRIAVFNSVFTLISAFIIVFLAIDQVNKMIVEEKKMLMRNSKFLICCGLLIFHTYKIMVESFYVMKINQSNSFLSNIFIILVSVNLFVNLLYALATIWIPTRQRFTMQY